MNAAPENEEFELDLDGVKILSPEVPGQVIQCLSGMIWLTQEGDVRDHVLTAGRVKPIDRPGRVALQALKSSRVRIFPPDPRGRTAAA